MSIKITDHIKEVLEAPCFGFIAVVDNNGQPMLARHFGYTWDEPLTQLTVFAFIKDVQPLALYFSQDTQLAVATVDGATFKALQFKGTYHKHYMAKEEEIDTIKKFNKAQGELIYNFFGLSNEIFANWNFSPALAIVMDVAEVFEQTPKKNTGTKIS